MEQLNYLTIDEEGYFLSNGIRWTDASICREALTNLHRTETGAHETTIDGRKSIVECFDQPLIAQTVSPVSGSRWKLNTPYDFETEFDLKKLVIDEWDRFLGRTENDISFAFSRQAQEIFFSTISEFDDESFTYSGVRYQPATWPVLDGSKDISPESWSESYKTQQMGWDLGGHHPSLEAITPQLKLNRCRVLVVGAGAGHDAAFFARLGHIVTALDFSPEAISKAKSLYGNLSNLTFVQGDALKPSTHLMGKFDLVFEHTCYCAIAPADRNQLVKTYRSVLTDQGQLLAIFPVFDKAGGPPFASSEWELRRRLSPGFNFLYWSRSRVTTPRRLGQEVIVFANRKS